MSDQRQQQVDDEAVILHSELNQYDVILGRGTGPAERAGNANYRDLVLRRKKEYLNLGAKNFQKKKRIAMEIISAIESMGGRFLKPVPNSDISYGESGYVFGETFRKYYVAPSQGILEKTKQALRQTSKVDDMYFNNAEQPRRLPSACDDAMKENAEERPVGEIATLASVPSVGAVATPAPVPSAAINVPEAPLNPAPISSMPSSSGHQPGAQFGGIYPPNDPGQSQAEAYQQAVQAQLALAQQEWVDRRNSLHQSIGAPVQPLPGSTSFHSNLGWSMGSVPGRQSAGAGDQGISQIQMHTGERQLTHVSRQSGFGNNYQFNQAASTVGNPSWETLASHQRELQRQHIQQKSVPNGNSLQNDRQLQQYIELQRKRERHFEMLQQKRRSSAATDDTIPVHNMNNTPVHEQKLCWKSSGRDTSALPNQSLAKRRNSSTLKDAIMLTQVAETMNSTSLQAREKVPANKSGPAIHGRSRRIGQDEKTMHTTSSGGGSAPDALLNQINSQADFGREQQSIGCSQGTGHSASTGMMIDTLLDSPSVSFEVMTAEDSSTRRATSSPSRRWNTAGLPSPRTQRTTSDFSMTETLGTVASQNTSGTIHSFSTNGTGISKSRMQKLEDIFAHSMSAAEVAALKETFDRKIAEHESVSVGSFSHSNSDMQSMSHGSPRRKPCANSLSDRADNLSFALDMSSRVGEGDESIITDASSKSGKSDSSSRPFKKRSFQSY